jgi:hypothetical protein
VQQCHHSAHPHITHTHHLTDSTAYWALIPNEREVVDGSIQRKFSLGINPTVATERAKCPVGGCSAKGRKSRFVTYLPIVLIFRTVYKAQEDGDLWSFPSSLNALEHVPELKSTVQYNMVGRVFFGDGHYVSRYVGPNRIVYDYDGMKDKGIATPVTNGTLLNALCGKDSDLLNRPEGKHTALAVYVLAGGVVAQNLFFSAQREIILKLHKLDVKDVPSKWPTAEYVGSDFERIPNRERIWRPDPSTTHKHDLVLKAGRPAPKPMEIDAKEKDPGKEGDVKVTTKVKSKNKTARSPNVKTRPGVGFKSQKPAQGRRRSRRERSLATVADIVESGDTEVLDPSLTPCPPPRKLPPAGAGLKGQKPAQKRLKTGRKEDLTTLEGVVESEDAEAHDSHSTPCPPQKNQTASKTRVDGKGPGMIRFSTPVALNNRPVIVLPRTPSPSGEGGEPSKPHPFVPKLPQLPLFLPERTSPTPTFSPTLPPTPTLSPTLTFPPIPTFPAIMDDDSESIPESQRRDMSPTLKRKIYDAFGMPFPATPTPSTSVPADTVQSLTKDALPLEGDTVPKVPQKHPASSSSPLTEVNSSDRVAIEPPAKKVRLDTNQGKLPLRSQPHGLRVRWNGPDLIVRCRCCQSGPHYENDMVISCTSAGCMRWSHLACYEAAGGLYCDFERHICDTCWTNKHRRAYQDDM